MSDENAVSSFPDTEKEELRGEQEENFAAMLGRTSVAEKLYPGRKVRARVVSISGDLVYIDLGGKSEGAVDLAEFTGKDGTIAVREGDEIEAFFVNVQDGLKKLTTLVRGYSALTLNSIRDANEAGIPVNGEVKREIKGGFEVSVNGVRCFCPFSQIDLKGGREGGVYLGRTFPFRVLEYGEEGRKIVLSRRAVLEQEKQAKIRKLREALAVGMEIAVEVKSLQNFGAFADLGGIDGLIPASEISWDRSVNPSDVLSVGQNVTVKILSLDWENNRLTLSMKAMQPDPWDSVAEKYPVDGRVSGSIVRLAPFGAFVRLEPGVEGLLHISNLGAGRRINHPREVVEAGQEVEVYVLSVDPQARKISLSMQPRVVPEKIVLPSVGEVLDGTIEKVMPYGIFLKMNNGVTGLLPNQELGTPAGADHKHMFPSGTVMQVTVIDVDAAQNKVRLSRRALLEKTARDEFDNYRESTGNSAQSSGALGTLGDILRAKMEEKKKLGQPLKQFERR